MAKTVNYTEAQLDILKSEYVGADNASEVAAIAEKIGKKPASVRAKLASLGLYKVPENQKSIDVERVTKSVIAEAIAQKVGLLEAEVDGLSKASRGALDKILAALA